MRPPCGRFAGLPYGARLLPETYPLDERGAEVGWDGCRAVGRTAWDQGEPSIAWRSAAARPGGGEELAWFVRGRADRLREERRRAFDDWFA